MNGDLEREQSKFCSDSDKSAYRDLVKAYSGRVFAICLGILGNINDAEDVTQQTLLKGLTNIKQIRNNEQFSAWISRIAKNLCIDYIRMQKRRRNYVKSCVSINHSISKDYTGLESALAKLPEEHRLPLILFYFDGRSTKTIAETLNISEAAVQTRLSRARKQLRNLLKSREDA